MEADEGDGNAVRIMKKGGKGKESCGRLPWSGVPEGQLVTLLFLLDNGDKTTGDTEKCKVMNTTRAVEVRDALEAVLRHPTHSFEPLLDLLKKRHNSLIKYPVLHLASLQPGTPAADWSVRKEGEEVLVFVNVCRSLGLDDHHHDLHHKARSVQTTLGLTPEETDGNFFLYAENLRMKKLCSALNEDQVVRMYKSALDKKLLGKKPPNIQITAETLKNKKGLKETLFFYLIRQMELDNKLNRIYTDRLEELLHELGGLEGWMEMLEQYPAQCHPSGHCVVFCVTTRRSGADGEIHKVCRVFHKTLGYTLTVKENPTLATLQETLATLQCPKYHFYDSLVVWVMAHGTRETLELADGTHIERRAIIDDFSLLENFRKKPKIFFMASCQGRNTISIRHRGGVAVTVDGANKGDTRGVTGGGSYLGQGGAFSEVPERCLNITAVAYQMDRLVAHATLPHHYSFRLKDGGSVYVDYVCRLLERYAGHNITLVLERVCNKMHQILFSCHDRFEGEAKQACYYETTFQKTFVVPEATLREEEEEEEEEEDTQKEDIEEDTQRDRGEGEIEQ